MWVLTVDGGFYSAVQHRQSPDWLVVRSRVREDAQHLADWLDQHANRYAEVSHTPDADYAFRVIVRKTEFAEFLGGAANAIDYDNFKNAVAKRQGAKRAHVYGSVWADLYELQESS